MVRCMDLDPKLSPGVILAGCLGPGKLIDRALHLWYAANDPRLPGISENIIICNLCCLETAIGIVTPLAETAT